MPVKFTKPTRNEDGVSRAVRDLAELLEAANRVLPEYTVKLDRFVQSALALHGQRDKLPKLVLERLGAEFHALTFPLNEWINKLSAALEERPLTELQKLELRLRLTDLEMKYLTAHTVLSHLDVLPH